MHTQQPQDKLAASWQAAVWGGQAERPIQEDFLFLLCLFVMTQILSCVLREKAHGFCLAS